MIVPNKITDQDELGTGEDDVSNSFEISNFDISRR